MSVRRTHAGRVALGTLACLASLALAPAHASAVQLSARPDVLKKADIRVAMSAEDTAGMGVLLADGVAVGAKHLEPSQVATYAAIPLSPGTHRFALLLRTGSGAVLSAPITVRSWNAPATPACPVPATGLQRKQVALLPVVGGSTTKLSVLCNGRWLFSKTVTAPGRVPITVPLSPGYDTIELRAENPVARTSKSVGLFRPIWPVPGHYDVGSKFGPRGGRMHKGIDIHAPQGSPVVATGPGTVIWAKPLTSYGGLVMIYHGGGDTSYYAHLSRIDVRYGQKVTAGQRIGAVGTVNVAHLHFQIFTRSRSDGDSNPNDEVNSGIPTDPLLYVSPK